MNVSRPVFNREKHAEFFTVLKKRVNLYFDQRNITKGKDQKT